MLMWETSESKWFGISAYTFTQCFIVLTFQLIEYSDDEQEQQAKAKKKQDRLAVYMLQ